MTAFNGYHSPFTLYQNRNAKKKILIEKLCRTGKTPTATEESLYEIKRKKE